MNGIFCLYYVPGRLLSDVQSVKYNTLTCGLEENPNEELQLQLIRADEGKLERVKILRTEARTEARVRLRRVNLNFVLMAVPLRSGGRRAAAMAAAAHTRTQDKPNATPPPPPPLTLRGIFQPRAIFTFRFISAPTNERTVVPSEEDTKAIFRKHMTPGAW